MKHQASLALIKFLSDLAKSLGVSRHVYVVGGAVRNFVMDPTGRKYPVKDIDVVIDSVALSGKDSDWFAKEVAKAIPARTNITTNQYGVALLNIVGDWMLGDANLKGEDIEIANARTESYGQGGYTPESVEKSTIEQDVGRREFTFNTLLWRMHDLANGPDKAEILDLTGCGLRDLQEGVMKCPSSPDKTFTDDPSRMVRAVKFLVKYGFTISPEVKRSIHKNKAKLHNIPHAHLSNMLINTFLRESTGKKALIEMQKLGLLDVIKEIAQKNKPFRAALGSWADKEAKVDFIFDLMDMGLPSGKRLGFLDQYQLDRVREITVGLSHDAADQYVRALQQPGKVLDTKSLMQEFNLQGKAVRGLQDAARRTLLSDPTLVTDGRRLTQRVRTELKGGRVAAMEDQIPGGLGDKKKPSDFDSKALAKGQKVEMEHTDDPAIAREIAMDHLTEDPDYYDKLETIEKHARDALDNPDPVAFLTRWYGMDTSARSLSVLKQIHREHPEYRYEGPAFRLAELGEDGKPWVQPPTSWTRTKAGMERYRRMSGDDGWQGVMVQGNIRKGLHLGKLAKDLLREGVSDSRVQDIAKADEIAALDAPSYKILETIGKHARFSRAPTTLAVFDFDGTLFKAEEQPPEWWKDTTPYSWGSSYHSLSPPCVPARPGGEFWNGKAVGAAKALSGDANVLLALVTGRIKKLEPRIQGLLGQVGITPDRFYGNPGKNAVSHKVEVFKQILKEFPTITRVTIWENENLGAYKSAVKSIGKSLGRNIGVFPHQVNLAEIPPACDEDDLSRTAKTFTLNRGDPLFTGKYLNSPGRIEGFKDGPKGDPMVIVRKTPKKDQGGQGAKKEVKLFKVRYDKEQAKRDKEQKKAGVAKPGSKGQKSIRQGRFVVWYLPRYEDMVPVVLAGLKRAEAAYARAKYRLPDNIPVLMAARAFGSMRSIYSPAHGGFIQLVPSAFDTKAEFGTFVHELAHYVHGHQIPSGFGNRLIQMTFSMAGSAEARAPSTPTEDPLEKAKATVAHIEKLWVKAAGLLRKGQRFTINYEDYFSKEKSQREVEIIKRTSRGRKSDFVMKWVNPTPEELAGRHLGLTKAVVPLVRMMVDPAQVSPKLGPGVEALLEWEQEAFKAYNDAVIAQSKTPEAKYENPQAKWFPTGYSKTNPSEWFAELVTTRVLAPSGMDPDVKGWLDSVMRTGKAPQEKKAAQHQLVFAHPSGDIEHSVPKESLPLLFNRQFAAAVEASEEALTVVAWDGLCDKVAAKFQKKKEVPKSKGTGTTTVYEYSEGQIQNRNREKAKKVEKLRGSLAKLRSAVTKDLKSGDEKTRLSALAVGLMNDTYERVGNEGSAKDGHFGVTGWQAQHVSFSGGKATITYVGKSGVKQSKTTTDAGLVAGLKAALKGKSGSDSVFDGVDASTVNSYLKPHGITAKDIRGLHANREVQTKLKAIRGKGGKLPTDKKKREEKLKKEFEQAVAQAAEAVGHEPSTLRSQYLVPGIEDNFLRDGTVKDKLDKQGSLARQVAALDITAEMRRLKEAGIFQPPPQMVKDIGEWVVGQAAANRLGETREKLREAKGRRKKLEAQSQVKDFQRSEVLVRQAMAVGQTRALARAYTEFWKTALSLWGYYVPQLKLNEFTGLKDARRLKTVRANLERILADANDRLEEYLDQAKYEIAGAQREVKELKRSLVPGVKPMKGEATREFPVNLEGWAYGGQSLIEEFRERMLKQYAQWAAEAPDNDQLRAMIDKLSESVAHEWETIKVSVTEKLDRKNAKAYWQPAFKRIAIEIPKSFTPEVMAEDLKASLEHELRHFGQSILANLIGTGDAFLVARLPQPGMPSRHITTPQHKQRDGDPSHPGLGLDRHQQHDLDDVEFYTNLAGALPKLHRAFSLTKKREAEEPGFHRKLFNWMVGAEKRRSRSIPSIFHPIPFFVTLRDYAKGKWKKAVAEAYKDVFKAPMKSATKSDAEKEEGEVERLNRRNPTKKPPRPDLRRNRMKAPEDMPKEDGADSDKDLSLNYKKLAAVMAGRRVAARWVREVTAKKPKKRNQQKRRQERQKKRDQAPPPLPPLPKPTKPKAESHKPGDVWQSEDSGVWVAINPEGVTHTFGDGEDAKEQASSYAKGLGEVAPKDGPTPPPEQEPKEPEAPPEQESETPEAPDEQKPEKKPDEKKPAKPPAAFRAEVYDILEAGLEAGTLSDETAGALKELTDSPELYRAYKAQLKEESAALAEHGVTGEMMKGLSSDPLADVDTDDPQAVAAAIVQSKVQQKVLLDPSRLGGHPLSSEPLDSEARSKRAVSAMQQYRQASPEQRQQVAEKAAEQLAELDPDSPEAAELNSIIDGIQAAFILNDEKFEVQKSGGNRDTRDEDELKQLKAELKKAPDDKKKELSAEIKTLEKRVKKLNKANAGGGLLREPLNDKLKVLLKQMVAQGNANILFIDDSSKVYEAEGREAVRDAMSKLDDDSLIELSKGTAWESLGNVLETKGMSLDPEVAEYLRALMLDLGVSSMTTVQGVAASIARKKADPATDEEVYASARASIDEAAKEAAEAASQDFLDDCYGESLTEESCQAESGAKLQQGVAQAYVGAVEDGDDQPDPQDIPWATLRNTANGGDPTVADDKTLRPEKPFAERKKKWLEGVTDQDERKRIEDMTPEEFAELEQAVHGGDGEAQVA